MSLSKEEVAKVARLARIKMGDAELESVAPKLNGILAWVEQLGEVDTDNVEPLANVVDIALHLREDVINDGGIANDVLANAPEEMEDYFVVPKVVE